jgi:hypothetical protein
MLAGSVVPKKELGYFEIQQRRVLFNAPHRERCTVTAPPILGADRFAFGDLWVVPALGSATCVVSRQSLERLPGCVRGQCR